MTRNRSANARFREPETSTVNSRAVRSALSISIRIPVGFSMRDMSSVMPTASLETVFLRDMGAVTSVCGGKRNQHHGQLSALHVRLANGGLALPLDGVAPGPAILLDGHQMVQHLHLALANHLPR